jgi:hypothetical protein
MSEEPLPKLRPQGLQGKPYFQELHRILRRERWPILQTLKGWRGGDKGPITAAMIGALALTHDINFKAMCQFLEDENIIPCGMYEVITRDHRPTAILRAGQEWLAAREGPSAVAAAFEKAGKR